MTLVGGLGSAVASAERAVAGRFLERERAGFAERAAVLLGAFSSLSSLRVSSGVLLRDDRRVDVDAWRCCALFSTSSMAGDLVSLLTRRSADDRKGGRVSVMLAIIVACCSQAHVQDVPEAAIARSS